jgi:hypothetical protein
MFTFACEENALAMVNVHWPGPWNDESFRKALAACRALAERTDGQVRLIMCIKDGAPTPNASQRKAIAAITQASRNICCALVTRSHLHRAVMTAVTWMNTDLRERQVACATFEEACAWMAKLTGADSTVLRLLLAEAERGAAGGSVAPARPQG